jgi:UDP-N-acetylmuramyl pentapeptide phosphotransferase/UDP-N-acetylglucosamine-1-phosphate transferase
MYLLLIIVSFAVALGATYSLTRAPRWLNVLDHPNERSLHTVPVPRTGGLAILLGVAVGASLCVWLGQWQSPTSWLLLAASGIALVSFLDDRFSVAPGMRLAVQFGAAALFLWGNGVGVGDGVVLPGVWIKWPRPVAVVVALLFLVWMTNLYNFMDGMDGFAGGMAVFGFGAFAVFGFWAGQPLFATLSLVVAAAAAGFLVFNFPPARIFMGDTGSSTLGFLAGAFTLWADLDGVLPAWIGILVFSPFIADATVTLGRRLRHGHKVWIPHKTHYYQRLVRLGWDHRKTVLVEYVVMGACVVSAFGVRDAAAPLQWAAIVLWIAVYAALAVTVGRWEAGNRSESG